VHKSAYEIGAKFLDRYWSPEMKNVLEVGANNVNGSLKDFKRAEMEWVGVDLEPGKGVDIVIEKSKGLPFKDNTFDLVLATSVFEHDSTFWLTFSEMIRVVKPTGFVYICAPSNGWVHRYPLDLYRFYPDAGIGLVEWGRRDHPDLNLLESFIAERDDDIWNDFCSVFSKTKNIHHKKIYPDTRCTNIWTDGKFLESSMVSAPEDMRIIQQSEEKLIEVKPSYNFDSNARESRLHPYVAEALGLAAVAIGTKITYQSYIKSGPLIGLFTKHRSDKETRHNYAETYMEILDEKDKPHILEIGLGSSNGFPYGGGSPAGASIKAWREGYPDSIIVGADIDPVSVASISEIGFVLDQTSDESLDEFTKKVSQYAPFDLIVDDGFHDPHANLRTFLKIFPLISEHGSYVIEDIHKSLLNFWSVVGATLGADLEIRDLSNDRPETDDNILLIFTKRK